MKQSKKDAQITRAESLNEKPEVVFHKKMQEKIESNKDKIGSILSEIIYKKGIELSRLEFEIVGSIAYFVGLDFTNQPYPTKKVVDTVRKRLEEQGLTPEIMELYIETISYLHELNMKQQKDEMKNSVTKKISTTDKDKFLMKDIFISTSKIIKNSIIEIKYAKDAHSLLNKLRDEPTYHDILRINTLLNENCKFIGGVAIRNLLKLFSNQHFANLLQTAVKRYDEQKFAVVYFDGILTLRETIVKFGEELVIEMLTDKNITTARYNKFEKEFKAKQKEKETVKAEKVTEEIPELSHLEKFVPVPDAESDKMFEEDLTRFIYEMFCEYTGYQLQTVDEAIIAINKIIENTDYAQHIYTLLKTKKPKDKTYNVVFDLFEMVEKLNKIISENQQVYKTNAEKQFKEIPENLQQKAVNYVNSVINDLILQSIDEKQYLVSQVIENGIETVNHLIQIVQIIEQAEIIGSQLSSYVTLHDFIDDNEEIKEVFTLANENMQLSEKTSFYIAFKQWYELLIPEKTVSE